MSVGSVARKFHKPIESWNVGTFGLVKIQNADVMPDRAPLFGLPLASKEQFLASLKKEVLKSADFPYGCS